MNGPYLILVILSVILLLLLLVVVEINLSLGTLTAHHVLTEFIEAWCRVHCVGH